MASLVAISGIEIPLKCRVTHQLLFFILFYCIVVRQNEFCSINCSRTITKNNFSNKILKRISERNIINIKQRFLKILTCAKNIFLFNELIIFAFNICSLRSWFKTFCNFELSCCNKNIKLEKLSKLMYFIIFFSCNHVLM